MAPSEIDNDAVTGLVVAEGLGDAEELGLGEGEALAPFSGTFGEGIKMSNRQDVTPTVRKSAKVRTLNLNLCRRWSKIYVFYLNPLFPVYFPVVPHLIIGRLSSTFPGIHVQPPASEWPDILVWRGAAEKSADHF